MNNKVLNNKSAIKILIVLCLVSIRFDVSYSMNKDPHKLYAGWATRSITPDKPVALGGQFGTRISSEILDTITCTALALETRCGNESIETGIMISLDLIALSGDLHDEIKKNLSKKLPQFDLNKLVLNATHTHTAPALSVGSYNIPEDAMQPSEYVKFAAEQIAIAATEAWNSRKSAGMSWGLGQAVVGYNRRTVYQDPVQSDFGNSSSVMYGDTYSVHFSHIEGYEDHGVEMIFFWDENKNLTGIILNVACPAQETEHISQLSADFWHEVRVELHKKYGKHIFIMPQIAAAGDITSHILWRKRAEDEMLKRKRITRRQEIGRRIANAVEEVFPYVQENIEYDIVFCHTFDELSLPRRRVSKSEVIRYQEMAKERPEREGWYKGISNRYKNQDNSPFYPSKVNVIRLGDVVIATNPFELFLDYGLRIKSRSDATLTFVIQLSNGGGTYVATERAEQGGGYSAIAPSNAVGSEGGQELVEKTIEMINRVMN